MTDATQHLAAVVSASANGLAADAAQALLSVMPGCGAGWAQAPFDGWRAILAGRLQELAAAAACGRPAHFAAQIAWARDLLAARGLRPGEFETALACLRTVLAEKLPEPVRNVADAYLAEALASLDAAPTAAARLSPQDAPRRLAMQYLCAILEGEPRRARDLILERAREGWRIQDIFADVLAPAAEEVGRMWHTGDITVAEEHLATATTKTLLAQLAAQAQPAPHNGMTALVPTVEGNTHDMGVQMLAFLLELDGWRSLYLGGDVPDGDLAQAVECFGADLLCLSAALTLHLPAVRRSIAAVRRTPRGATALILAGGTAIGSDTELARHLGADATAATLRAALQLAREVRPKRTGAEQAETDGA